MTSGGGGGFWGWLTGLFSKPSTANQAAALRTFYAGETYYDANGNPIEISKLSHPYQEFEGTKLWKSIDKAITKLAKNGDLCEQTGRAYIVGYLVKSVIDSGEFSSKNRANAGNRRVPGRL